MSVAHAFMLAFGIFAAVCGMFVAADAYDKRKKLAPPLIDERNWSNNYMADYKRWTARR